MQILISFFLLSSSLLLLSCKILGQSLHHQEIVPFLPNPRNVSLFGEIVKQAPYWSIAPVQ